MTAVPVPSTTTSTSAIWRATLLAALAGTVVNVVLFVIGKAAGADFVVAATETTPATDITVANVIVPGLVAMLIGAVAAVIALPRWAGARRGLEIVGAVLALGTGIFPWVVGMDTGTRVLLTLMHVVLAVAYVAGIEAAGRESAAPATPATPAV